MSVGRVSFPSTQQACSSLFQGNLRGRSLKGPRSTTGRRTRTQFSVLYLIVFVNCTDFYKTEVWFAYFY
jgi:hypothetical protein